MILLPDQPLRSFINQIPFKTRLKIRSLGWERISYQHVQHTLCYLKVNFNKYLSVNLPEDDLLREQFVYELSNYDPYRHQELVLKIEEPVLIEPLIGAVIVSRKRNNLIEEALALPKQQTIPLPFLPMAICRIAKIQNYIEKAISLRHAWGENNYFHFYNDILPKLALLQEIKEFSDYPIIVSKKLYNTLYFQEAIEMAGLKNKQWLIQDSNTYLGVKQLVVVRAHELTVNGLLRNLKLLRLDKPRHLGKKNCFITRPKISKRTLTNRSRICEIAERFNFDIIDCSQLTLAQQIDFFANSRIIVGEHGAAFANIIYRYGNPLSILELFPPYHVSTCYFVISQALNYRYNIIRSKSESNYNYEIDPKTFQETLDEILQNVRDNRDD